MAKSNPRPTTSDNLLVLLALDPYVLDRGEVSVAEAAEHFGRSENDISRAVELIACAGIPGDNLAYSHLDLFDIDWDPLNASAPSRYGIRSRSIANLALAREKPPRCSLDCSIWLRIPRTLRAQTSRRSWRSFARAQETPSRSASLLTRVPSRST